MDKKITESGNLKTWLKYYLKKKHVSPVPVKCSVTVNNFDLQLIRF